jgi:hypothetical protein
MMPSWLGRVCRAQTDELCADGTWRPSGTCACSGSVCPASSATSGLSTGAVAGIAVAGVLAVLGVGVLLVVRARRQRASMLKSRSTSSPFHQVEGDEETFPASAIGVRARAEHRSASLLARGVASAVAAQRVTEARTAARSSQCRPSGRLRHARRWAKFERSSEEKRTRVKKPLFVSV